MSCPTEWFSRGWRARRDRILHGHSEHRCDRQQHLVGEQVCRCGARFDLVLSTTWLTSLIQTDGGAGSSPANPPTADVPPPAPSSLPRLFVLDRHQDPSGVSGTGVVAEGAQFSDGAVALHWLGDHPATAAWPSVDDLLAVHGHGGATELRWLDQEIEA